MTNWEYIAKKCENDYGIEPDWDDLVFDCPNCGEPLFECDWAEEDFVKDNYYICPVCRLPFFFES